MTQQAATTVWRAGLVLYPDGLGWSGARHAWMVVAVFFGLGMLTSSFDVLLVLEAGFNIRAAQLFLSVPLVACLPVVLNRGMILPIGFASLAAWTGFILAFIPNTTFLPRSLAYGFWLLYNVALIFATVQLFTTVEQLRLLLRWYLYSFLFVALFGVAQFTLPLLGLGAPLVTQWWIYPVLPRVNGFSYEPSFYATYLLIGWTLSVSLLQMRSRLFRLAELRVIVGVLTLAMLLSSSRAGWLAMALWCVQYPVRLVARLLRGRVDTRAFWYFVISASLVAAGALVISVVGLETFIFLLSGIGLAGASGHSVEARGSDLLNTLRIFLESPMVGHSLGGVAAAIAELRGFPITSLAETKLNEGISVFAEVLVASGIIGFIPFVVYIVTLVASPLRLARVIPDPELRRLLLAMTAALVFELMILQINQNILRLYLWVHIALLSAVYSVAARSRQTSTEAAWGQARDGSRVSPPASTTC